MTATSPELAGRPRAGERAGSRAAETRRRDAWRAAALVAPLLLWLGVVYAYPVLAMLLRSVSEPTWTLANYARMVNSGVVVNVFWITIQAAVVVTVVALLLGYPLAYLMATVGEAKANLILILVLIPFWTSILVRTYAWMVLLGREGIVNQALKALGLTGEPVRLLNTTFAVYIGMVHILLPFMILPLYSVMRGIDRNLIRAAYGLGARPPQVFWQVILPLSLPGIAAGCLVVFILGLGFYITPALLGSPRDMMISMLIAQQVDANNWPFASALAFVLLVVALGIFVVFTKVLGVERLYGGTRP